MLGNRYAELASELLAAGIASDVPCVVISRATTKDETIYRTTLGKLPQCPAAASPSLLVVGSVVSAHVDKNANERKFSGEVSPEIMALALQHPIHDSYRGGGVE
jgi:siroheme synthase